MKKFFLLAVTTAGIALSLPAQNAPAVAPRLTAEEKAQGYSNRTLLAKPRSGTSVSEITAAEAREGRRMRRSYPRMGQLRLLEPAAGETVAQAAARLRATGRYEYVEPDYIRKRRAVPNDPKFAAGELWHLQNTGQNGGTAGADIGAVAAWDLRSDASSVIVAVIDTGIRATHEDLAANLWTNPDEIPGNGIDDDHNGYIDDVHGINSLAALGSAASGEPDDDYGHGTAVAGAVGAVGHNGKGIVGVAWKVRIMALKFDDAEGSATVSNAVECIDYALAKGARILNYSYGSYGYSQAEYEAIRRARDAGVIFVTAAGNDQLNNDVFADYPSNYPIDNILVVASTDRRDTLSDFSNYGTGLVELAAPGSAITSTDSSADNAYQTHDGTSFSSPLVAGALALLQAQFPNDNYRSLINRLLSNVDPLPSLAGKVQTGGRLNVSRALHSTEARPFNDNFASRATLAGYNFALRANTQGATSETGEPSHAGASATTSLWWTWNAPASGAAVVDTNGSGIDTVAAVYTGTSLGTLVPIAANDDATGRTTSRVAFTVTAGTTYQIVIGGKNQAAGTVVAALGYVPDNDNFSAAASVTGLSARVSGFNTVSGVEPNEPKADASATNHTVWYRWVAPQTAYYSFSIFSYGFDAVGAVYRGSSLANLVKLDTASTSYLNEAAYFRAIAGTIYYFQVDSADGMAGAFDLTVVDALPLPGYYPANPSPAYIPQTGYLVSCDTYGGMLFFNLDTTDVDYAILDGTLEVHTPAIGIDGSIFIGDEYGYLQAFNPDFKSKWKQDLGLVRVTSSPALGADGSIYVHTDDGLLHAYFADGHLKWRAQVPGESYSSPSIGDYGTIYIGSDDGGLYALAPLDGAVRWRFQAEGEIYSSPAIDAAGNLYFGTLDGKFYSITSGGVQRWQYAAGGAISSSPAIGTDGTIYFGCYDTNLYALAAGGTLKWKYPTGDEIRASSPAIASDGTVYIGSYDGYVHAVTVNGLRQRTYATGAYIRSSPMIHDQSLFIGSGDNNVYIADIFTDLANSPWPMHRQNIRRTGRRLSVAAPSILTETAPLSVANGDSATLVVETGGAEGSAYQWSFNGNVLTGGTASYYTVDHVSPAQSGLYTTTVTNSQASASATTVLGVTTTGKVAGDGTEVLFNQEHPNKNIFDQVLLGGAAASITADPGQITRMSYIDLNGDIVQVEFSGAGTLSLVLDSPSGPAAPEKYTQPTVSYMKGHAGIVIAGANETTNVSVFSVGRATAFDPTGTFNFLLPIGAANDPINNRSSLFAGHETTVYDGLADIAFIAIQSANGKFGGLRTANTSYFASKGFTGIYAPGVAFQGPVFLGDLSAFDTATPGIVLGSANDVRITGGDLLQANSKAVQVSGIAQLKFADGITSQGTRLPAQQNKARLEQNGADVTTQIVVNP